MTEDERCLRMVERQLQGRGIRDERVLAAFRRVPRHRFVPGPLRAEAYDDHPLSIGEGQTISQPYMVALMVEALRLQGSERVLEIGTGSGYQTAILSFLALEVYSVERIPLLAQTALERLRALELLNTHVRFVDGTHGWPEQAPFDAVIVSAAAAEVPHALAAQLADGGRLILPLGPPQSQVLTLVEQHGGQRSSTALCGCVFVPLITP